MSYKTVILCCLIFAVVFVVSVPIDSDPTDNRKRDDIPSIGDPDDFVKLKLWKFNRLIRAALGI